MEEKELQKEEVEDNVEKAPSLPDKPKGYYLAQVPASYAKVIAYEDKEVSTEELIIKMANALKDAGIMK